MKKLVLSLLFVAATLTTVNASAVVEGDATTAEVTIQPNKVNAFCLAIVKGDTEMVKKMIDLGQDVNEKSNGMTPAMYAARYNKVDILELLIAEGANLRARCSKGHTAKYYAKASKANDALEVLKSAS